MKMIDSLCNLFGINKKWNPDKHVVATISAEDISATMMNKYLIYLQSKLCGWFTYQTIYLNDNHQIGFRIMAHVVTPQIKQYFASKSSSAIRNEILALKDKNYSITITKLSDGFTLYRGVEE